MTLLGLKKPEGVGAEAEARKNSRKQNKRQNKNKRQGKQKQPAKQEEKRAPLSEDEQCRMMDKGNQNSFKFILHSQFPRGGNWSKWAKKKKTFS